MTRTRRPWQALPNEEIELLLEEQGFDIEALEPEIRGNIVTILRRSSAKGCLLWTTRHIVSTDPTCPLNIWAGSR